MVKHVDIWQIRVPARMAEHIARAKAALDTFQKFPAQLAAGREA